METAAVCETPDISMEMTWRAPGREVIWPALQLRWNEADLGEFELQDWT